MPLPFNIEKNYLYTLGYKKGYEEGYEEEYQKVLQEEREEAILLGWKNGVALKTLSAIFGIPQKEVRAIIRKKYPEVSV